MVASLASWRTDTAMTIWHERGKGYLGARPRSTLKTGESLLATGRHDPQGAWWIVDQCRCRPDRTSLKIATAVGARRILEAFHAVRAPCALERADVRLVRGGDVAVAAFVIWADLKHVTTLIQGIGRGSSCNVPSQSEGFTIGTTALLECCDD